MKGLILGQYVPGDSVVHRLDSRAKALAALVLAFLPFLPSDLGGYGWLALLHLLGLALSRIPLGQVWRAGRLPLILVVVSALFKLLVTPGTPAFQMGPVVLTQEGLQEGVRIGCRLGLLLLPGLLLVLTTSPLDLATGLAWLMGPGRRLGVPVDDLALMVTIALRFVPTLVDEASRIARAQASRGADTSGAVGQRLSQGLALAVPLFSGALRRAEDLAVAMESRCYEGSAGRTPRGDGRFRRRDWVLLALVAGLALWLGWLRWGGSPGVAG